MSARRKAVLFRDLPRWVREMVAGEPEDGDTGEYLWTLTESGVYEAWRRPQMPASTYHPRTRKLPEGVDRNNIVDWYDLPVWVKGSYRSDAEMRRLQSFTWVRADEDRYNAYTPEGEYAGPWVRE